MHTPRSNAKTTTNSRIILFNILRESHAINIHVVARYIVDFRSVHLSSRICADLFFRVHVLVGTLYIIHKQCYITHGHSDTDLEQKVSIPRVTRHLLLRPLASFFSRLAHPLKEGGDYLTNGHARHTVDAGVS